MTLSDFIPALVAAGAGALASWMAIRVSVAELKIQVNDLVAWKNNLTSNGGPTHPYVRRGECVLMEGSVREKLSDIHGDVEKIEARFEKIDLRLHRLEQE